MLYFTSVFYPLVTIQQVTSTKTIQLVEILTVEL